jgi:hypothetical protein
LYQFGFWLGIHDEKFGPPCGAQVYFLTEYLRGGEAGFFDVEIMIYNSLPHWFFWTFVITICVLFVIEFFVPHLARGAIIGLSAKAHRKQEVEGGLVLGLYNFFPMFAIDEIFLLGHLATTVTVASLVFRYVQGDVKGPIIVLVFCVWMLSSFLRFCASFAPAAAVIERVSIFTAIGQSFKLIVSYLRHIMFLMFLLLLISVRVAVNAVAVLVIPAIVVGIALLLSFLSLGPVLSYSIAAGVGVILILIASYFFAYLHVFREAAWTITYMELRKRRDLDVIDE